MMLSASTGFAQSTTQLAQPSPFYARGNVVGTIETSYVTLLGSSTAMPSVHVGGHYFVRDSVSLGLDVSAYGVWQDGDDAVMLGLAGVLRHHFARFDRATIFADVSFGPYQASNRVPEDGTHFNFITRVWPGATFELNDRTQAMVAARYWHLSNARLEGQDRNPSLTGAELSIGLLWRW